MATYKANLKSQNCYITIAGIEAVNEAEALKIAKKVCREKFAIKWNPPIKITETEENNE